MPENWELRSLRLWAPRGAGRSLIADFSPPSALKRNEATARAALGLAVDRANALATSGRRTELEINGEIACVW